MALFQQPARIVAGVWVIVAVASGLFFSFSILAFLASIGFSALGAWCFWLARRRGT